MIHLPRHPLADRPRFLRNDLWLTCNCIILAVTLATFRASGAPLLDPEPEAGTTHFGYAIAALSDIDGDGHPDLAVGAPYQDGDFGNSTGGFGPPQNVGKVFLLNGVNLRVIRELDDPQFQMEQPLKFGGQFGSSMATVSDLNHDGATDVIIGVPHHVEEAEGEEEEEEEINSGEAFVFSAKDGVLLFTLTAPDPAEGARFGSAVMGVGDVNGDGVSDLVVGEPKRDIDEELQDSGAAYVFSGADGTLLRTLTPPSRGGAEANGRFGASLVDTGDLDQDGVHDILIGAPGDGRAFVISGASGAVIRTVLSPARETLPSFGYAVAGGKDMDRDGTPDFVIGAPLQNKLTGAAYLYKSDGTLLRTLKASPETFAKFGSSVAVSEDLTGDGRPDIIVGAPDHTANSLPNAGTAFIFRGTNGKLSRQVVSETPAARAGFGYVSVAADLTGSGTLAIISGAPFQNADLDDHGDVETHLQIGQIEVH
jgi:hypothetical protein